MRKLLGFVVAIVLGLTVQAAISRAIPPLADRVDLLLIVVASYGIGGSPEAAMLAGAVSGLLQDVWFSRLLGSSGFRKVLTGYVVGYVGSRFSLESPFACAAALAVATLLDHAAGVLLGLATGLPLADPFSRVVVERAIINTVVGTLCISMVRRLAGVRERRTSDRSRRMARRLRSAR